MDKILIFEDTGAKNQFIANCETTKDQANDLINVFESYQDLAEITTADQFAALVSDPVNYFDDVLKSGLNLQTTGNRTPDPETLAKLFSYDRTNFINTIRGLPTTLDCPGCKTKTIIRKTRAALTEPRFNAYRNYLTFTPEGFELNKAEIEKHCERFKAFAETDQQVKVVELFKSLVDVLNTYDSMFPLAGPDKDTITRIFGLHIERPPYEGRFLTNPEHLRNSIYK